MADTRGRNGGRPDIDVSEHAHDAISKAPAELLVGHSPRAFGVDAPRITAVVATELPEVVVRTRMLDFVYQTEDGWYLHIEFQSGAAELTRFLVYDAGLFQRDGHRIRTAVVYTGQVSGAPDILDIGSAVYQVQNVFIRRADGDRVYDGLVAKVEAGRTLDGADAVRLAFMVLMRHERRGRFDVAVTAAQIARRLPDPESREHVLAAIAAFGQEVLDHGELTRLLDEEVFRMTLAAKIFLEQGEAKGRVEGRAEGEAKGRAEAILLLLRSRLGEVPAAVQGRILGTTDVATLDRWLVLATEATSVAEFDRATLG